MSRDSGIAITMPYFPKGGHPDQEKARQRLKEIYGNPNVSDVDDAFHEWRSYYCDPGSIPEELHPFIRGGPSNSMIFSHANTLGIHHFITHIQLHTFGDIESFTVGDGDPVIASCNRHRSDLNALYYTLLDALENKRFKADKNLRIELLKDKNYVVGTRVRPEDNIFPRPPQVDAEYIAYLENRDVIQPIILKGNDCDFTVYCNYGKFSDDSSHREVPSSGKSRILFYLVSPQANISEGVERAEIDIFYEMAKRRYNFVHPPGQSAEKLLQLHRCQLSPQETLSSVAHYLEHDLQFYEPDGKTAIWWRVLIDRLKHFTLPVTMSDPRWVVHEDWNLKYWGHFPFKGDDDAPF